MNLLIANLHVTLPMFRQADFIFLVMLYGSPLAHHYESVGFTLVQLHSPRIGQCVCILSQELKKKITFSLVHTNISNNCMSSCFVPQQNKIASHIFNSFV